MPRLGSGSFDVAATVRALATWANILGFQVAGPADSKPLEEIMPSCRSRCGGGGNTPDAAMIELAHNINAGGVQLL